MPGQRLMFGRFVFDTGRATLFHDDAPIALGHRGLALLQALLEANGQIVTKAELMDAAWPSVVVEESNLSVQIAALRKVLGQAPDGTEWIATVPRVGYRFNGAVAADESVRPRPTPTEPPDSGLRPAVAVLPFDNLSNDTEQEYFADGITEDIIIAISRFRWFFVIARNSTFVFKARDIDIRDVARKLNARYVLEGSVRKSGRRVRITAQLIDAGSAHQVWADRYDVDLGEIFAVQDRIAEQVAGAIEPELLRTESALAAKRRRTGNVNAWDIVLQGTWFFHQVTRGTHVRARELFRQAYDLDPELPEANLWLARVNAGLVAYGWSGHEEDDLGEGVDAALRAVQIDGRNPYAHYALAIISVYSGALDRAIRAAEKALELSPSFALAHLVLGMARLFSGSATEAIEPLEHGLRLNPYDPQNFVWYNVLALAHLFANDANKASETAARALKVRPNWRPTLETLACCEALRGDFHAARVRVEQIATLAEPTGDVFGPLRRQNPRWAEDLAALLRRAGMAEPDGSLES